ncbi:Glucosamine-6-phosphate isomerase (Glucosamine-6-phosphate deaminase) (GNPDA) (GlcN6P deaminase) [Massospora cicadina]|nr:Glucosamine-6-phosphate isomerase (Glucosamine-6-phosphate deaminase) (GNPDA) (GlcN6P deaminase) [Massospora cicadina]
MKSIFGSFWLVVGADPGMLWPKPTSYSVGNGTVIVDKRVTFTANVMVYRLDQAMNRTRKSMVEGDWIPIVPTFQSAKFYPWFPRLRKVRIKVASRCQQLSDTTDEKYQLKLNMCGRDAQVDISAATIYGAIHALKSLDQMTQGKGGSAHRGLLLDTSRNYYPLDAIKRTIRALSLAKMNVFHWHMVDSHSWPFQSEKHPILSEKGAIDPRQIYTFKDIKDVVNYALDHGVRVIPELEAPAHSYAIGLAYPEIMTCMDGDNWNTLAAEPPSGQIDPTNPKSIAIVNDIIDEFADIFRDKYIHLSGDEVNFECWNTTSIRNYLKDKNMTLEAIFTEFASKMHQRASLKHKSIMVWQEILLNHNVTLPKDALVQVWLGAEDTKKVIERGHRVVASSYQYWYLDCGKGAWIGDSPQGSSWCDPFKHWQIIYTYDLLANLTQSQQSMVAGGEVAIWSEQVDEFNLDAVAWPRTAAAAEVLWSGNRGADGKVIHTKSVLPRFNNFRFYLVHNKIRAEPNQPLWCVVHPGRCDTPSALANLRDPYLPK